MVKSSAGYHIIRVLDHLPLYAEPLKHLYVNVGYDAATDKGDRIARHLADSLFQGVRTPAQARAAGKKLGLETESSRHMIGDRAYAPSDLPTMIQLEKVVPGQLFPGIVASKGRGWTILWVDSIAAPSLKTWDRASSIVVPKYMAAASERCGRGQARRDGFVVRVGLVARQPRRTLGRAGAPRRLPPGIGDRGPRVARGRPTRSCSAAPTRRRSRAAPRPAGCSCRAARRACASATARRRPRAARAARIATERRVVLEYKLIDDFKDMRARYPVKIVDPVLRDTPLPTLPPPPEL